MAKLIKLKSELKNIRSQYKQSRVGFVPTMGNLHEGHLSLMKNAAKKSEVLFISIFVNPTQFGPNEDFENYPRTLENDFQLIENLNLNIPVIVFAPDNLQEVYPKNFKTNFSINTFSHCLCGTSRPGHFNGVLSVIYHLFNLVEPTLAIFGQKDYQQFLIIKSFAEDIFPKVTIEMAPIIREKSGLALSSRNGYLNSSEKNEALFLKKTLTTIENDIIHQKLQPIDSYKINQGKLSWDYLEVLDANNLKEISKETKKVLIAGALFVNQKVRIIDNILLEI